MKKIAELTSFCGVAWMGRATILVNLLAFLINAGSVVSAFDFFKNLSVEDQDRTRKTLKRTKTKKDLPWEDDREEDVSFIKKSLKKSRYKEENLIKMYRITQLWLIITMVACLIGFVMILHNADWDKEKFVGGIEVLCWISAFCGVAITLSKKTKKAKFAHTLAAMKIIKEESTYLCESSEADSLWSCFLEKLAIRNDLSAGAIHFLSKENQSTQYQVVAKGKNDKDVLFSRLVHSNKAASEKIQTQTTMIEVVNDFKGLCTIIEKNLICMKRELPSTEMLGCPSLPLTVVKIFSEIVKNKKILNDKNLFQDAEIAFQSAINYFCKVLVDSGDAPGAYYVIYQAIDVQELGIYRVLKKCLISGLDVGTILSGHGMGKPLHSFPIMLLRIEQKERSYTNWAQEKGLMKEKKEERLSMATEVNGFFKLFMQLIPENVYYASMAERGLE